MKKFLVLMLALLMVVSMFTACSSKPTQEPATAPKEETTTPDEKIETGEEGQKEILVGFSQGTMNHPFRVAMVEENIKYAEENYPWMKIIATDGNNESSKQVTDVEDLLAQDIDVLLISPLTEEALTGVCEDAMAKGIPVICLDRTVNCDVTCYIGAENKPMGVAAADKLAEMLNGKGTIIELQGTAGASATIDRHDGFVEQLEAKYPDLKIIADQYCDYLREPSMKFMEDMLQRFGPGEISAVYCHNDEMALGALEAIKAAGRDNEGILLIGMDGMEVAFDAIKAGDMAFTVVYPYCAPEGVIAIEKYLKGELDARWQLDTAIVSAENVEEWTGKGL